MKRFLLGGFLALGLAATAAPAKADFCLQWNCCHNLCIMRTRPQRCFSFSSCCAPVCASSYGYGYSGPAPWNALAAYGYRPAPVAAAPAAAAPAAPNFKAPAPTPAPKAANGVQQAGYSYYGQTVNGGYGYDAGYNYGAGYGYYGYGFNYNYAQAPNYWY